MEQLKLEKNNVFNNNVIAIILILLNIFEFNASHLFGIIYATYYIALLLILEAVFFIKMRNKTNAIFLIVLLPLMLYNLFIFYFLLSGGVHF